MSLTQESPEAIQEEKQIQQDIFNAINSYQNIIFNAGAGAGKTYSLIESLKYIINNKAEKLVHHNQNIICITYTNVATNEIKERLGNTKLVKVSTIHERLWDLISPYRKQLVGIHIEKLNEELEIIQSELNTEAKFQAYRDISDKDTFTGLMIENKSIYYQNKDKNAAGFKTAIKSFLNEEFYSLLGNVSNFKSLIGKLYKIENYQICLEKIEQGEYKQVVYDARYNNDRLHKMMISHDTLLEYAYSLINRYDMVKQIIIDKYPFILVDEYQDTAEKVIRILKLLDYYSQQINHNLFIGYFGDTAQNIYDTGVGKRIFELHTGLTAIDKRFNRRSTNEIIQVINAIRNDTINQVSIYSDADGGSVVFYQGSEDSIDDFIEHYQVEWGINQDNKLHCLVLTNELVAKYNKFENIFQKLKATPYYKTNWNSVTTEILSHDLSKLGEIPNLLYRIVDFKQKIENPKTPIIDILSEKTYKHLTFAKLKELIVLLRSINRSSLKDFVESILHIYSETEVQNFKRVIEELFDLEVVTTDSPIDYMLSRLFPNVEDDAIESARQTIYELLEVTFDEYIAWFEFVNKIENKEIIYHTYHGTKGEDYENVIILMQNNFGRDRNKFPDYFYNYPNENNLVGDDLEKFINTKNLLYVSCSRAIKNLRILYIDKITDFRNGIEAIFGNIHEYQI
jgi:DNA helicase-2/ATP-dependent DNA helicase PcrA